MRIRTLTLPGQPDADGIHPHLIVIDDAPDLTLVEAENLRGKITAVSPARGVLVFSPRVDLDD